MPTALIDGVLTEVTDEWVAAIRPSAEGLPPAPREIAALAFRRRFTTEERGAFTVAAAQLLAGGDPSLQMALDDMNAAQAINLDDPDVAAQLGALVAFGLLAPGRPAEILA